MLYENPFSFTGFLIQIICITLGPTWFTAAIYFTLSRMYVKGKLRLLVVELCC